MNHALGASALTQFAQFGFGDHRISNLGLVIGLHAVVAVALYAGVRVVNPPPPPPPIITLTALPAPVPPPQEVRKVEPQRTLTRSVPQHIIADTPPREPTTDTLTVDSPSQSTPPTMSDITPSGRTSVGDPPSVMPSPSVGVVCPNVRAVQADMRYPREALRNGVHGEVVVRFTLTPSGQVLNPRVVSTTPSVLNRAALSAVALLQCTGQTQDTEVDAPFLFRLTE
jgi:periplasmic protein TonB